jgi:hypothetical protein
MSKKSRLKAQKDKQIEMKKLADLEELEEKEEAKLKESKAARKMRRKARREKKRGGKAVFMLLKIIMLAAFLYSGFFYGGVTIVGAMTGAAELIPKSTAWVMIAADVIMAVGLILAFVGKDRVQALFNVTGSAMFLYKGIKIVCDIQERMDKVYVDDDLADMDKSYMLYYYPIAVITVLSLIIAVAAVIRAVKRKRREKIERDNAPVESIVGNENIDENQ